MHEAAEGESRTIMGPYELQERRSSDGEGRVALLGGGGGWWVGETASPPLTLLIIQVDLFSHSLILLFVYLIDTDHTLSRSQALCWGPEGMRWKTSSALQRAHHIIMRDTDRDGYNRTERRSHAVWGQQRSQKEDWGPSQPSGAEGRSQKY